MIIFFEEEREGNIDLIRKRKFLLNKIKEIFSTEQLEILVEEDTEKENLIYFYSILEKISSINSIQFVENDVKAISFIIFFQFFCDCELSINWKEILIEIKKKIKENRENNSKNDIIRKIFYDKDLIDNNELPAVSFFEVIWDLLVSKEQKINFKVLDLLFSIIECDEKNNKKKVEKIAEKIKLFFEGCNFPEDVPKIGGINLLEYAKNINGFIANVLANNEFEEESRDRDEENRKKYNKNLLKSSFSIYSEINKLLEEFEKNFRSLEVIQDESNESFSSDIIQGSSDIIQGTRPTFSARSPINISPPPQVFSTPNVDPEVFSTSRRKKRGSTADDGHSEMMPKSKKRFYSIGCFPSYQKQKNNIEEEQVVDVQMRFEREIFNNAERKSIEQQQSSFSSSFIKNSTFPLGSKNNFPSKQENNHSLWPSSKRFSSSFSTQVNEPIAIKCDDNLVKRGIENVAYESSVSVNNENKIFDYQKQTDIKIGSERESIELLQQLPILSNFTNDSTLPSEQRSNNSSSLGDSKKIGISLPDVLGQENNNNLPSEQENDFSDISDATDEQETESVKPYITRYTYKDWPIKRKEYDVRELNTSINTNKNETSFSQVEEENHIIINRSRSLFHNMQLICARWCEAKKRLLIFLKDKERIIFDQSFELPYDADLRIKKEEETINEITTKVLDFIGELFDSNFDFDVDIKSSDEDIVKIINDVKDSSETSEIVISLKELKELNCYLNKKTKEKKEEIEQKLKILNEKNTDLENELNEFRGKQLKLENELQTARSEKEKKEALVAEKTEQIEHLKANEEDNKKWKKKSESKEEEIKSLKERQKQLENDLELKKSEIDDYKSGLREKEKNIKGLKEDLNERKLKINDLNRELDSLTKVSTSTIDLKLPLELKLSKERIDCLEKKLKEKKAQEQIWNNCEADHKNEKSLLREENKRLKNELKSKKTRVNHFEELLEKNEQKKEEIKKTLEQEIIKVKQENKNLKTENKSLEKDNKNLSNILNELNEKNEKLKISLEDKIKTLDTEKTFIFNTYQEQINEKNQQAEDQIQFLLNSHETELEKQTEQYEAIITEKNTEIERLKILVQKSRNDSADSGFSDEVGRKYVEYNRHNFSGYCKEANDELNRTATPALYNQVLLAEIEEKGRKTEEERVELETEKENLRKERNDIRISKEEIEKQERENNEIKQTLNRTKNESELLQKKLEERLRELEVKEEKLTKWEKELLEKKNNNIWSKGKKKVAVILDQSRARDICKNFSKKARNNYNNFVENKTNLYNVSILLLFFSIIISEIILILKTIKRIRIKKIKKSKGLLITCQISS